MNKFELVKIQGELINAAANGGEAALWSIARGNGEKANVAREAIEVATSPYLDITIENAIVQACKIREEGDIG